MAPFTDVAWLWTWDEPVRPVPRATTGAGLRIDVEDLLVLRVDVGLAVDRHEAPPLSRSQAQVYVLAGHPFWSWSMLGGMGLEDIVAGRPEAVRALHVGDAPSWAALVDHAGASGAAPAALVDAMMALDPGFASWDIRARAVRGGRKAFWPWLLAGIERGAHRLEPAGLAMRLEILESALADLPRTLALVAEIDSRLPGTLEHARALLLAARRQREAGAPDAALGLAGRARALLRELGDASWHQEARLAEAASLVLLERLDEALDVVEAELPGPVDRPLLARRRGLFAKQAPKEPPALALHELAVIIGDAASLRLGAPIVRALGGVAEHEPAQRPRFERWLARLATEAPGALDTVARQAAQRGFERTVEAARLWRLWHAAAAAGPLEPPPGPPRAPDPTPPSWSARLEQARARASESPLLREWVQALQAFREQGPPRSRPPPRRSPDLDWAAVVDRVEPAEAERLRRSVAARLGRHGGDPRALLERVARRSARKALDVHLELERRLHGGRRVELGLCDPARRASGFDWDQAPTRFVVDLADALDWTPMIWARSLALHALDRPGVPTWVHLELAQARAAGARPAIVRARWSRASVTHAAADKLLSWLGVPTDPVEAPPARPDHALAPVLGLLVSAAALAGADGVALPEAGSATVILRDQAHLEPLVAWWRTITDEPLERQVLDEASPHPVRQGVLGLGPSGAWAIDEPAARWFLEQSLAAIAGEPTCVGREVLRQVLAAQLARELAAGVGAGLAVEAAQAAWAAHDAEVRAACLEQASPTLGPLLHGELPPVSWPATDGPADEKPAHRFRRLLAPGLHVVEAPPPAPHALDQRLYRQPM